MSPTRHQQVDLLLIDELGRVLGVDVCPVGREAVLDHHHPAEHPALSLQCPVEDLVGWETRLPGAQHADLHDLLSLRRRHGELQQHREEQGPCRRDSREDRFHGGSRRISVASSVDRDSRTL